MLFFWLCQDFGAQVLKACACNFFQQLSINT